LRRLEYVDFSAGYESGLNKLIKVFSGVEPAQTATETREQSVHEDAARAKAEAEARAREAARQRVTRKWLLISLPALALLIVTAFYLKREPIGNKPLRGDVPSVDATVHTQGQPSGGTEPRTSAPPVAKGQLNVQASSRHATISTGEVETIDVRVTDQGGLTVPGASVALAAGGGKFLSSDKTPDPSEHLMEAAQASGVTGNDGVFTTWWACRPCAPGYEIDVSATKQWYAEGKSELVLKTH
jgi:hypothetical protein